MAHMPQMVQDKPKERQKVIKVCIPVSPKLRSAITTAAKGRGLTRAAWVRMLVLERLGDK